MASFSIGKKSLAIGALLALLAGVVVGIVETSRARQNRVASLLARNTEPPPLVLTEKELEDLTMPGIIRIHHRVTGEAKIPSFSLNIATLEVKIDQKKILAIPIDYESVSTGVIIHPSGYIATNAHAVSEETVKYLKVTELVSLQIVKELFIQIGKGNVPNFDEEKQRELTEQLLEKEYERIIAESTFDLVNTVRVLDPSREAVSREEEMLQAFPATILFEEPRFIQTGRDSAIIKINEERLPALPIESKEVLPIGRKVFLFGFPEEPTELTTEPYRATLIDAFVRALKEIRTNDLRLYELDAKLSKGSLGGPVLNDKGRVYALLTAPPQTLGNTKSDTFALAVPASALLEGADNVPIDPAQSAYYTYLLEGIGLTRQKRCTEGLEKFGQAADVHGAFVPAHIIQGYTDECRRLIDAGESIDSGFNSILAFLETVGPLVWAIVALVILGAIAIGVYMFFIRKRSKGSLESETLTGRTKSERTVPTHGELAGKAKPAYTAFLTKREEKKKDDAASKAELDAINYTRTQFKAGFTEDQIVKALKESGWKDEAIRRILLLARVE